MNEQHQSVEWRSLSCEGERCAMCGAPASAKVGENIFPDDPLPQRHGFTAYLCHEHFTDVMGIRSDCTHAERAHAVLRKAVHDVLSLRDRGLHELSPDTVFAIGEAAGMVSKARSMVGRDIDDTRRSKEALWGSSS